MKGDIEKGLEILQEQRNGYGHYLLLVEKLRLLIVLGKYSEAKTLLQSLRQDHNIHQLQEISDFITMCTAVLENKPFKPYNYHPWVEINLGQWHMLAISERLQGKPIDLKLETLHQKAKSIDYQLYLALGDSRFW